MINIDNLIEGKSLHNTTAIVAMSGGVDSSTIATYLHKKGCNVIGITLKLYQSKNSSTKTCCNDRDIYDAKKVAEKCGFPHYIINYEKIFKEEVIEKFAQSYLSGETPIPCILCNQTVKFRDLLELSKNLGADTLVTGHYVRRKIKNKKAELHQAVDLEKDQSYFLFTTTQEQLDFLRFPLGDIEKNETRHLAETMGVPTANKKDSQNICFVGDGKHHKIIDKISTENNNEGNIILKNGKILGKHSGIHKFTIGQRHGLRVSFSEPLYVTEINKENNEITVGIKEDLKKDYFDINIENWLEKKENLDDVSIKIRSGIKKIKAKVNINEDNKSAKIEIKEEGIFAISPGQACVIYKDSKVLGGGWIKK
ncbi:tRNA 2-thiouridine(34) synthase MnmA [Anaplasmataceae bacterium AB001_6]|nr:tRNA 2-thiouridine(34) synthase MnmA [Anaplasmataceae bacterium AB001_6]